MTCPLCQQPVPTTPAAAAAAPPCPDLFPAFAWPNANAAAGGFPAIAIYNVNVGGNR